MKNKAVLVVALFHQFGDIDRHGSNAGKHLSECRDHESINHRGRTSNDCGKLEDPEFLIFASKRGQFTDERQTEDDGTDDDDDETNTRQQLGESTECLGM